MESSTARQEIDQLLASAGWHVCDLGAHDISRPCAIRELPLKQAYGHADYLLYLHGKAAWQVTKALTFKRHVAIVGP